MRPILPPSPRRLAAAPVLLAAVVFGAAHARADDAGAVFAGIAVRDPAGDALAERAAVALAQALEKRGVVDLGTPPLPVVVDAEDPILESAVGAAVARYQEADFARALDRANEAVQRFEKRLAFVVAGPWPQYARALLVKSLAERKLGRDDDADLTLGRLATTRPGATLDPTLANPGLIERYQALLDEQRKKDRVQIEVTSVPSGADVVVDGEARGKTPLVVRDLLPGTHFVALEREGIRHEQPLVALASTRLDASLGDPRADATKALREAVAAGRTQAELLERARAVGDDVLFGLLVTEAGAGKTAVVLARAHGGELSIAGTYLEDKGALRTRLAPVGDALLDGVVSAEGAFIPDAPGSPRTMLFAPTPQQAPPQPAEEQDMTPWLVVAGVGGAVLVLGAGAAIGTWFALQAGEEVHVALDASQL